MSTLAYVDSQTITQADGAHSSRVSIPLPDDPYVAVRRAQLVDTESEPEEAPSEAEELQSLGSRVPLIGEEFEAFEPIGTRTDSSHSSASSDSTTPLSPDHPLTYPVMSSGHLARVTEAVALLDLAFRKRYRSSYGTPSPPSTLSVRKRYRGTFELILDTDSEGDELGDEDTDEDESSDADDERERGQSSRSMPEQQEAERVSAFRQPTLTSWVDPEGGRERVAVTFGALWRPVLALDAWAGQTDAQRAALWHAIYDIQRENHDLRMQLAEERHKRLELANRVARIEMRHESREE
ncbi:hypothetical protein Tco_0937859 [Tanacetum coccineum]|uniref:Uncharacterized protein n=1 Tax=Tanacetum coccineum TaxID=301880 RepID=A0ABQ5DLQ2_9ASTR